MANEPVINSIIVGLNKPGTRCPTLIDGKTYMRNRVTGVVYPLHDVGIKRESMEIFIHKTSGKEEIIPKEEPPKKKISFANAKLQGDGDRVVYSNDNLANG